MGSFKNKIASLSSTRAHHLAAEARESQNGIFLFFWWVITHDLEDIVLTRRDEASFHFGHSTSEQENTYIFMHKPSAVTDKRS